LIDQDKEDIGTGEYGTDKGIPMAYRIAGFSCCV
jgi:hypothetical protein